MIIIKHNDYEPNPQTLYWLQGFHHIFCTALWHSFPHSFSRFAVRKNSVCFSLGAALQLQEPEMLHLKNNNNRVKIILILLLHSVNINEINHGWFACTVGTACIATGHRICIRWKWAEEQYVPSWSDSSTFTFTLWCSFSLNCLLTINATCPVDGDTDHLLVAQEKTSEIYQNHYNLGSMYPSY